MKKTLAILGNGGHAREVADAATLSGWKDIKFFDDLESLGKVEGDTNVLLKNLSKFDGVIVAIGDNLIRWRKIKLLKENSANLVSIIHPSATISEDATIGTGSAVFAGVVINPGCSIGDGAILNTSAVITHDCKLGTAIHISPGAVLCGNVNVSDFSWIGANAVVIEGIKITNKVNVGSGAVVIRDIKNKGTYVGNPAKKLTKK
tara:strand:+ start:41810 stop:42421 length:612 start_codon:yes stop_codon:yes gene_type:complete